MAIATKKVVDGTSSATQFYVETDTTSVKDVASGKTQKAINDGFTSSINSVTSTANTNKTNITNLTTKVNAVPGQITDATTFTDSASGTTWKLGFQDGVFGLIQVT